MKIGHYVVRTLCIDVRGVGHSENWSLCREFLCFDMRVVSVFLITYGERKCMGICKVI